MELFSRLSVGLLVGAFLAGVAFAVPVAATSHQSSTNSQQSVNQSGVAGQASIPDCDVDKSTPTEDDDCGFLDILNRLLTWMAVLVIPIVTIVIIVGGIQIIAAGDNAGAIQAAKKRIMNALIALVFFIMLWLIMEWLIPGF